MTKFLAKLLSLGIVLTDGPGGRGTGAGELVADEDSDWTGEGVGSDRAESAELPIAKVSAKAAEKNKGDRLRGDEVISETSRF